MSVWLDLFHPGPCFRWALSSVLWRLPDCAAFSVVRWWPKPHLTMENATFAGNRLPTWGGANSGPESRLGTETATELGNRLPTWGRVLGQSAGWRRKPPPERGTTT